MIQASSNALSWLSVSSASQSGAGSILSFPGNGTFYVSVHAPAGTPPGTVFTGSVLVNNMSGNFPNVAITIPVSYTFAAPTGNNLTVGLNSYYGSNFVITPGNPSQRVALFQITAGPTSSASINTITLSATRNAIGNNFQNLRLENEANELQLGSTQGQVASNGVYTFNLSNPLVIPAGSSVALDVLVDVASTATASNFGISSQNLVSLNTISGTWSDGTMIGPMAPVAGQTLALAGLAGAAPLSATLSATSPVSQSIASGSTNQLIAVYNLVSTANATVQEMDFQVVGTTANPIPVLIINGIRVPTVNNVITFAGPNVSVPAGYSGTIVSVYADCATVGNNVPANTSFALKLTQIKYTTNSIYQTVSPGIVSSQMTLAGSSAANLTAYPASLNFSYTTGASVNPASQNITLTNTSSAAANYISNYAPSGPATWLATAVYPNSLSAYGSAGSSITFPVAVNPVGLAAGTYSTKLIISGNFQAISIPITLIVNNANVVYSASPTSLSFSLNAGQTNSPDQSIVISSNNPNVSDIEETFSGSWIGNDHSQTTGGISQVSPVTLKLFANNPNNLAAGTYTGSIAVTKDGAPMLTIPLTLTVNPAVPSVTASPSSLSFSIVSGVNSSPTQTVTVSGLPAYANIGVTQTSSPAWLNFSVISYYGTFASFSASVNQALAVGTYNNTIKITGSFTGSPIQIPVTLTVASGHVNFGISPTSFTPTAGSPASWTLGINSNMANAAVTICGAKSPALASSSCTPASNLKELATTASDGSWSATGSFAVGDGSSGTWTEYVIVGGVQSNQITFTVH